MSYAEELQELLTKSVIPDLDDRLDEIFTEIADNKDASEDAKEEIEELREFKADLQDVLDDIQSGDIDIAISPQQATIGSLLTHIRRGDVVKVHSLRRGAAEAIEAIAHGEPSSSKVVGKSIEDIKLPPGTTIGAIVRGKDVIIAHHDTIIQSEDHVIMFLVDKKFIPVVERLFQVGITFI